MSDRRVLTVETARPHLRRGRRALVGTVALAAVLPVATACGAGFNAQTTQVSASISGTNANVGSVQIRNIRIQSPVSGVARPTTDANIYASILNSGRTTDRLLSASTPAAAAVWIPSTDGANAVPTPGGALVLLPNRTTKLAPTTTHLRLTGLRTKQYAGQFIRMSMRFQRAGITIVDVPFVTDQYGG